MTGVIPASWSNGAAIGQRAGRNMDVILHLGAHRTGSTTFQSYMQRVNSELSSQRIGYWGPQRTRQGLFAGLLPAPRRNLGRSAHTRAEGRGQMHLARSAQNGLRTLVVSDENMIGSVRQNLRAHTLYPAIGERMARFARAFDGRITRIVLSIRANDLYWASAVSYGVSRGHRMLQPKGFEQIATSHRTWRGVITDLSCALPGTEIRVLPFERFQGCPDATLAASINAVAPQNTNVEWLNRAPDAQTLRNILTERRETSGLRVLGIGRWLPFNDIQRAILREAYADDMHWLISGADGLARLTEDTDQTETGNIPHFGPLTKGQGHDKQERQVARDR